MRAFSTLTTLPQPPSGLALSSPAEARQHTHETLQWLSTPPLIRQPISQPIREHLLRCKHVITSVDNPVTELERRESWSWPANVIWVTSDHQVLDPAGRLLANAHADEPDPLAVIPFPLDARRRQIAAATTLRNRLVDPVEGVLPLRGEDEITTLAPAEAARRSLALFLVATRAESVLNGQPIDSRRMRARCPLGYDALTSTERAFFEVSPPLEEITAAQQTVFLNTAQSMVWRYEALATLQWALGMQLELPWPDQRPDLTAVTRLMIDLPDSEIIDQARLRDTRELLDAAELHYQALHAIADAQQAGPDSASVLDANILDSGIVCERLTALAWLCGVGPAGADWDTTVQWVESGCV